jgi:heme oxygenase
MAELKSKTSQLHRESEAAVDIIDRLKTRDRYADLLSRFYGLYAPLEEVLAAVSGWSSVGINMSERRKAHLILPDLATLGWDESQLARIPLCDELPTIDGLAAGLGCLYVLEGSTLGAQHIRRAVESHLGLIAEQGCRFFSGYGSQRTARMWRAFGESVEAFAVANPSGHDSIIAAAEETFVCFKRWVACREI